MSSLGGRCVVLGVGGGIAAYKAVELCRQLVDGGAHVVPVLTAGARRFVGEITFSALASERALTSLWEEQDPVPHISLARRADVVVVAPATADLLASLAAGLAPDLLTATLLATAGPVLLCPAMHTEMWEHPAVRHNVEVLRSRGTLFVGPARGRLAAGDEGVGRLEDPARIVEGVVAVLGPRDLAGRTVLVTAGGTREPVDAVRYLANRSSGKQGHALAREAAARGADVTLVTAAPLDAPPPFEVVQVETAADMETEVLSRAPRADVVVMAAAVADFRPRRGPAGKIDRASGALSLELERTPDILAAVARGRRPGQVLVGFAAEVGDPRDRARAKLEAKGVDIVAANDVTEPGAGFGHETNHVWLVTATEEPVDLGRVSKRAVAAAILDHVVSRLPER